jgi:hypothetical protein
VTREKNFLVTLQREDLQGMGGTVTRMTSTLYKKLKKSKRGRGKKEKEENVF